MHFVQVKAFSSGHSLWLNEHRYYIINRSCYQWKRKKKRKDESPYRIQLCTYVTHTISIISRRTMEAKQGETKAFKHEDS